MNVCSCFFLLTGAANENGNVAEDSETIPDQTPAEGSDAKPADEPAVTAASAVTTAATPPAAEESQDAAGRSPDDTSAAAAGDSTAETAASSSEAEAPAPEPGRRESQTGMRLNLLTKGLLLHIFLDSVMF